jgi:hypothetical protein
MPHIGGIKQYFHEPDQYNHAHAEKSAHFIPNLGVVSRSTVLFSCPRRMKLDSYSTRTYETHHDLTSGFEDIRKLPDN